MYEKESNVVKEFLNKKRIDNINLDRINCISMDDYGVTTDSKDVLFTYGLETCIGLIVTTKDFAFLAHIDNGHGIQLFENEFHKKPDGTWDIKVKKCKIIDQLYNEIYRRRNAIKEPIKVTVCLGTAPIVEDDIHRWLIEDGINGKNGLINKCRRILGIDVERQPDQHHISQILVNSSGEILLEKGKSTYKKKNSIITAVMNSLKNVEKKDVQDIYAMLEEKGGKGEKFHDEQ